MKRRPQQFPAEEGGGASILSPDSRDDLATMAEIIGDITRERRLEMLDDAEVRWRLEGGPSNAARRVSALRARRSRAVP